MTPPAPRRMQLRACSMNLYDHTCAHRRQALLRLPRMRALNEQLRAHEGRISGSTALWPLHFPFCIQPAGSFRLLSGQLRCYSPTNAPYTGAVARSVKAVPIFLSSVKYGERSLHAMRVRGLRAKRFSSKPGSNSRSCVAHMPCLMARVPDGERRRRVRYLTADTC